MSKRHGGLVVLATTGLFLGTCQPVTREKPEWFIFETYREAVAEYRTLSARIVTLEMDGRETDRTAALTLARPNLVRVETFENGKTTALLVGDGKRVTGWNRETQVDSTAPPDLSSLPLDAMDDSVRWGTRLLSDPSVVVDLQVLESTTEIMAGSEAVRVSGTETPAGTSPVDVTIWISPDSGMPLRYRRREQGRTLLIAIQPTAIDSEIGADSFTLQTRGGR